jgi:hypothetical protein
MKMYVGVEEYLHAFLTWALYGGEWSASRPLSFTPDTHLIWVCVGPYLS